MEEIRMAETKAAKRYAQKRPPIRRTRYSTVHTMTTLLPVGQKMNASRDLKYVISRNVILSRAAFNVAEC
jgi:hypothetical protein